MKLFRATLLLLFLLPMMANGQETLRAVSPVRSELMKSKEFGVFVFSIPESITSKEVAQSAEYYTMYFTVNFDEKGKKVTIKMVNNDEKSRHVIVRFFVSLGVRQMQLEGQTLDMEAFFQAHLK